MEIERTEKLEKLLKQFSLNLEDCGNGVVVITSDQLDLKGVGAVVSQIIGDNPGLCALPPSFKTDKASFVSGAIVTFWSIREIVNTVRIEKGRSRIWSPLG